MRMRPHEDSLEGYRRTHPYLQYVSSFELHGVITSFKLATESCVIEFCIPSSENYPYYPVSDDRYFEDFLSDLRYHVRFTFERSGLAFTHKGLAHLLLSVFSLLFLFHVFSQPPFLDFFLYIGILLYPFLYFIASFLPQKLISIPIFQFFFAHLLTHI